MPQNRPRFEFCLLNPDYKAEFLQVAQTQQLETAVNVLKQGANISTDSEVWASIPE
jgi:hypothetical protein